ncbi:MAG: ABC transporter permease [Gammaproteobacteria bacterium]|nr:ABC transporter permease [Gammaproteobacteria bacterium]
MNRIARLILLLWVLVAVAGGLLPLAPEQIELSRVLAGPSGQVWLGADELGRDLLARLVEGAQVSFLVAFSVVGVAGLIGIVLGTWSGYLGGWFDHLFVRIVDLFLAFPGMLLAIALAGMLQPGISNIVIALGAVGWVGFARLSRAQVLALRHSDQVLAARALGAGGWRIVLRHLLPMIAAPLIVEATFALAAVIIAEAGLSFLGLGIQPPAASWGAMIRDGTRYMLVAPHYVLVPGLALFLVVMALNLCGDQLRDYLDVRRSLKY